ILLAKAIEANPQTALPSVNHVGMTAIFFTLASPVKKGDSRQYTVDRSGSHGILRDSERCTMSLSVEVDQEVDGRWLAEVPELSGVLAYGKTRPEAIARAEA